uniref:Nudix (Nucleoside diphosphate linked moiety X)-type motif 18 n=1 Tax=Nothobranchius korthausae TaxID=1143690 RepID=A0A1A8F5I7_9TELE
MEVTAEEERQVEEQVERLLSGQGSEVSLCDVGLELSKPATLRKNVTYIVCAVVFNEKEEVLMVQEAKQDCYKQWYLPAGRASWWDRQSSLPLRGRDILRLIEYGLKYHMNPWHAVTLPLDLSARHVVQRLVLVFVGAEEQVWVLLVRVPAPHLPSAAALRTHAVTWAANMVVQEAMPSSYYDHEVSTLGVFSLQHNGRQHGRTDGVLFNTLVTMVPDRVQRDEDGRTVDWPAAGTPPPVENPRYIWVKVQKKALREKLMEMTKNTSLLPIHSLY